MKAHPLIPILGLVLLAWASNGLANEVTRPELSRAVSASQAKHLATSDRRLNAIVQERLKSGGTRGVPSAICANEGQGWACAPSSTLRELQRTGVAGAPTPQGGRGYGRLADDSSGGWTQSCICERDSDDSPWVCNPPGCMTPVDSPTLGAPRSIDRRTTPQDRVTPQRDMSPRTMPRDVQDPRGTPRRRD